MKLAYRLLLVVGHTLGDLALPLMRRQCEKAGATMETLSPAQAERIVPNLERVLEAYLARPGDLKAIAHELRLEIGAERFAAGEVAPGRASPGGQGPATHDPRAPSNADRAAQGAPLRGARR